MTEAITAAWIAAGAAVGGGLVGGLVSGSYQHLRDWWNRPVLAIDFVNDSSHRVESTHKTADGREVTFIYLRIRVRNTGRLRQARSCRVFLAALEEVHPSGQTTQTAFLDARQLAWAGHCFVPLELPRDLSFYADLVSVSKAEPDWCFSVDRLFGSEQALTNYRGTYRFQVVVTADNAAPASCVVDVSYAGDWHDLRAVAVRK